MGSPSQNLIKWLKSQQQELQPGSRLPTIQALCTTFDVSPATVKRIARTAIREGYLSSVRGKGYFTPTPAGHHQQITPARSSTAAQSLCNTLTELITTGALKTGQELPTVKFCSLRYHVAPSTIQHAYRLLCDAGLATKMGKAVWVGGRDAIFDSGRPRRLAVFVEGSAGTFFNDTYEFSAPWAGFAFRRAESELIRHGYHLVFYTHEQLEELTRKANEKPFADAVFFHFFNETLLSAHQKAITSILKRERMPVFVDWHFGDPSLIPRNCRRFSRGNMQTSQMRLLASKALSKGYGSCRFYYNPRTHKNGYVYRALRAHNEFLHARDSFDFKITFAPPFSTNREIADWISQTFTDNNIARRIDKTATGRSRIEDIITTLTSDIHDVADKQSKCLFICPKDSDALEMIEQLRNVKLTVPANAGVISLENGPVAYHERISCCIPDWETIGYLIAHAIIGDIQPKTTQSGFIRLPALFLDRNTA